MEITTYSPSVVGLEWSGSHVVMRQKQQRLERGVCALNSRQDAKGVDGLKRDFLPIEHLQGDQAPAHKRGPRFRLVSRVFDDEEQDRAWKVQEG